MVTDSKGRAFAKEETLLGFARDYWIPSENLKPFDVAVINKIYVELEGSLFGLRKIVALETSQYLEEYLWPNYNAEAGASKAQVISIALLINEKFRERIDVWECIKANPEHFPSFFDRILHLALDDSVSMLEQTVIITFLTNCFNSVEVDLVRQQYQPLVSLPIWSCLLKSQRDGLLDKNPKLKKYWKKQEAKVSKLSEQEGKKFAFDRTFLWNLIAKFKRVLADVDDENNSEIDLSSVRYCERFIALTIDLESLLITRRFVNALVQASHLLTYCTLSNLIKEDVGSLFCQLVTMLKSYVRFEIDDINGQPLTSTEMVEQHYKHVADLQKAAFKHFRDSMKNFYLLNVAAVDTRKALLSVFGEMDEENIYKFAEYLRLVARDGDDDGSDKPDKQHLIEMIIFHCERRANQLQQLNDMPLYPTEKVIWDENLIPYDKYQGEGVLALNKLNLQFLTLHDYLMRNFNLFQMETTYEIRQDIENAVFRMKPWIHESEPKEIVWGGWARMALRVHAMQITKVGTPLIGEKSPSEVVANVSIQLPRRPDLRKEWENMRRHDVCFLVSCKATQPYGTQFDFRKSFKDQISIAAIRGCEVQGMLDASGKLIEEYGSNNVTHPFDSEVRTYRIRLDTNQYRLDMERQLETGAEDVYYTFNLIVRRDPKSNNFQAVLSTIRQLLNTECVVPDWLHELILGHGEPDTAHYSKMSNVEAEVSFNDTFLDYQHLVESFPDQTVVAKAEEKEMVPPFRLNFKALEPQHDKTPEEREKSVQVEPYVIQKRGPYVESEPKKNTIRFTPSQVEAIKSGMEPGLTVVVGPPGTGKTDVAVQIISNIYHNWPEQRTLIVTHSNQALNQLFEKIMALDVDERHLLRLGHGEEALETEKDFSRYGRVNYVLGKRLQLLKKVEKLQEALGIVGDVGYSCETAGHFYRFNVCKMWDNFLADVARKDAESSNERLIEMFPFTAFFSDVTNLFHGETFDENMEVARTCWRYISDIFSELEEFRAFEMLRNGKDRTEYLLVKEAKIIAMTCTLAALRRKDLVDLGFRYDNILMEESAQILEVETFIPLLLQNPQDGQSRLKRWIMIGDHHQLPPIVQNVACQKYSNLEQSLFARFVRLGVPVIQLDKQGRARPEIADLYNWKYKQLGNLPHVQARPEFNTCNPGFVHTHQFIDVPIFNGQGESTPSPFFYQNLGEAEYAVALYTYMRILGYPAEKISIITTYNGQASLIADVVKRRCADNPLIGRPHKISTVDKYQGQQNDYVILSLVRTNHIGHVRDVRRLIVSLSRARLGLYVLGRLSLYEHCAELKPAFEKLKQNPTKLQIVPYETYPADRKMEDPVPGEPIELQNTEHICAFVHEFYKSNLDQLQALYEAHMREHYARLKALEEEADAMETDETTDNNEAAAVAVPELPKKKQEGDAILFEEMDFEKLEEVPKY